MDKVEGTSAKVFTEGKTDWKHIKSANERLRVCPTIAFHETEDSMGDQSLLRTCESLAIVMQQSPQIFVFDNDNKEIVKKVTVPNSYYKNWGNNVYSLCLPTPPFRSGYENISIELLYKDEDIMVSSPDNRRLFLSSEFDERSGNHRTAPSTHVGNVARIKGAVKNSKTVIVDSDIGVFDSANNSLALSKSDFADYILRGEGPFADVDFRGFRQLLAVIKSIIDKSKASSTEVLTKEDSSHQGVRVQIRSLSRKDHPPHIPVFVGRTVQLKKLDDPNIRVAAITGLGGEGKSSIASQFFRVARDRSTKVHFQRFGWCDCKDLQTTFHDRLLILLEEITDGKEKREMYSDENIRETIGRFIDHLHSQDCLIVFDNVDAFVDYDSFSFTDSLKILFDNISEKLTRGLVVFTSRAPIHDYHPSFLEISAVGLSFLETQDLAAHFNIQLEEERLRVIHEATKGHALWLNLIFGQVRSGRITPDKIHSVMTAHSQLTADLDVRLLRSIWNTLDQLEKQIIWVTSTFTRPKPIEYIERASGVSYQKCVKVVRNLVSLRLIMEIDSEGITLFDLHPIIRTKAKEECGSSKLKSLSSRVIAVLIPRGSPNLAVLITTTDHTKSSTYVQNYIESVEISLEVGELAKALEYLKELSDNLWKIGEQTKFIDLCLRLFPLLDGTGFKIGLNSSLDAVFGSFINILLMQGEFEIADKHLTKFQNSVESIKQLMVYVELRGYFLWFRNDFQKAVAILKDGTESVKKKKEVVPPNIRYNLALALRDSGELDQAIEMFLNGRQLVSLEQWDVSSADGPASDLGNLGRCYFLKGEYEIALRLVTKSLAILERGESMTEKVNQGYAHLWIADILIGQTKYQEALTHVTEAVTIWRSYAPARLKKVKEHVLTYPHEFFESCGRDRTIVELGIRPKNSIRSTIHRIRGLFHKGGSPPTRS
jgi:tetratricopeptide (TPR) repeat protein